MKKYMNEELEKMSGEGYYDRPPRLTLDELALDGKNGTFKLRKLTEEPQEVKGKMKYPIEDLGPEVNVVFLKIRRKLAYYDSKAKTFLSTNEHNHKEDTVTLFLGGTTERDTAAKIREKYPLLKTKQIVYCMLGEKLVRLIVKGSSLGSQNKAEGVPTFYDYISSFKIDPETKVKKDEHFYECETNLSAIEETSDLGPYFAMNFRVGKKLEKDEIKKAGEVLKKVFEYCQDIDEYYGKEKIEAPKEELETIEYPEEGEEINPEEIPF